MSQSNSRSEHIKKLSHENVIFGLQQKEKMELKGKEEVRSPVI